MVRPAFLCFAYAIFVVHTCTPCFAQQGVRGGGWPTYGGDYGNTKYSSLDQIDRDNFHELTVRWKWDSPEIARIQRQRNLNSFAYEATPLVVDGVMFVSTGHCDVVAINPVNGETIWTFETGIFDKGRPTNMGFVHRGVTYWDDGGDGRIFIAANDGTLYAVNAKTGKGVREFGRRGKVDLKRGLRRKVSGGYGATSPPVVCRGTVIVGSSISDGPTHQEAPPGDVRGYDAMTGELRWTFQSIPQPGEFGNETWEAGSWKYTGNTNVWTTMSVDEQRGLVYLPFGTPTNDWYGGHRKGDGLFGESLVCIDAESGERKWHFQVCHHGVWDYDLPAAPALMDITVNGQRIEALAQVTKQGFCFVLDRVTGQPVWPVQERAVPQSTIATEQTSPTQPFPTKPAPFEIQGIREDDLINFTPELRAEALEMLSEFDYGPLYLPPNDKRPTVNSPGWGGGANWTGSAYDPDTQMLYIPSLPSAITMVLNKPDAARSDMDYIGRVGLLFGPQDLPLFKPPYLHVVAIDMKTGDHVWNIPIGDGPRDHPLLKDLDLPKLGSAYGRAFVLATKTLLLVANSAERSLIAFDKQTGEEIASVKLPGAPSGSPITYEVAGKQFITIPADAGGDGTYMTIDDQRGGGGILVTLSLP